MNERIIKNAVTKFMNETGIKSEALQEESEKILWNSIRSTRKEDPFLYEEMRSLSSIAQTNLLERRLFMEFVETDELFQCISEAVVQALEKALNTNECLGENYSEEYVNVVLEDFVVFLENDSSFKEKLQNFGGGKLYEFLSKVGNFVKNSLPTLIPPAVTYGLATVFGPPIWVSLAVLVGLMITVSLAVFSAGGSIQRQQIELIKDIVGVLYTASKFVKKGTERFKNLYQLTFTNEEKCYKKAGLDPKKLRFGDLFKMKDDPNSIVNYFFVFTDGDKLDILRTCYLENFLDRISIFFDLYFDCLKKTGNWNDIRSMSDDKFIMMFRMKGGLYPTCDQFRDNAVKAIDTFQNLVEFLYEKNPSKKSQWMLLLNRYIIEKKQSSDDLKREFRKTINVGNRRPTFRSEKYKKLGQGLDDNN